MLTAFITGIGLDMWLFLLHNLITLELWYSKVVICFRIGLVVIGLGTAIYLHTNFAPIPVDRLTLIIQELTRTSIFFSRTFIYLIFLIMAKIFNGPIGVGTLLTVCLGGLILMKNNRLSALMSLYYHFINYIQTPSLSMTIHSRSRRKITRRK